MKDVYLRIVAPRNLFIETRGSKRDLTPH